MRASIPVDSLIDTTRYAFLAGRYEALSGPERLEAHRLKARIAGVLEPHKARHDAEAHLSYGHEVGFTYAPRTYRADQKRRKKMP